MNIGLVTVTATLGKQREIGMKVNESCENLLKRSGLGIANLGVITSPEEAGKMRDQIKKLDFLILSVATGGTRGLISRICQEAEVITVLWATTSDNSLPSSLEAFSKIKGKKRNVRLILDGINKNAIKEINFYLKLAKAIKELESSTLGVVGLSPWLIATTKDENVVRKKLGIKLVKIRMRELLNLVKGIPDSVARKHYPSVIGKFDRVEEPKEEDIVEAIKIYLAMKLLAKKRTLDSITIKCFDMIQLTKNTACLGISFLNDEGIASGCEGDIDSVLTMMIANKVTNNPSFMANLARADINDNTITLVHCTVATKLCDQMVARSHFESRVGVSLQGELPLKEVTICRLGDNFNRMLILTGRISENLDDPNMCRTQIRIGIDGKVKDFILKTLGNHHILVLGNCKEALIEFCRFNVIEPVLVHESLSKASPEKQGSSRSPFPSCPA